MKTIRFTTKELKCIEWAIGLITCDEETALQNLGGKRGLNALLSAETKISNAIRSCIET